MGEKYTGPDTGEIGQGKVSSFQNNGEHFDRLIDGVRDCAIYMLDPTGNVVTWNPGAERIKGYTAEEIVGRNFREFYTPEDRDKDVPGHALSTAKATVSSRARDGGSGRTARSSGLLS